MIWILISLTWWINGGVFTNLILTSVYWKEWVRFCDLFCMQAFPSRENKHITRSCCFVREYQLSPSICGNIRHFSLQQVSLLPPSFFKPWNKWIIHETWMSGFDFDLQAKYIWCYNIESINMLLTYSSACRIKTWDSSFYSWSRLVIFGSTESCSIWNQSKSVGVHLVGCVDVLWATNKNNLCLLIGVLDSVRGEHSISTVAPLVRRTTNAWVRVSSLTHLRGRSWLRAEWDI